MAGFIGENTITRLSTTPGVDMKTVALNTLYTVPSDKTAYITSVVIRETSASLAGGTDYDLGTGANADTWVQTNNLSSMTGTGTEYMEIRGAAGTKYADCATSSVFSIKVITGSTGAATATLDVFGFLA